MLRGHLSPRVCVAQGPAGAPPVEEERGNHVMTAVATQEIPLVDLKAQYATIRDEVRSAIDEVLESMQLTIGPNVKAFDNEFASYIGTKHSIGVGSGTDALQLAIRACGVSGGDEVITVSHTFFATVEAILYANARPILVEELRALREHGQSTRYYHPVVGYNARLDEIQAAILRIKLKRLDQWNARRRELARMYDERLKNTGVIVPEIPADIRRHVFYTYTIRVQGGRRDDLRKYLGERGIGTQIHYPVPIHLQQSAQFLGYRQGDMPITERIASEVLSLPMFAELTDEQLERVTDSVGSFMK